MRFSIVGFQIDDALKKVAAKKSNTKLKLNDGFFRLNRMNCLLYKNTSMLFQQKT